MVAYWLVDVVPMLEVVVVNDVVDCPVYFFAAMTLELATAEVRVDLR